MPLQPKLVASYFTVAGDVAAMSESMVSPFPFRDRAEAAAKVGYIGIGLMQDDLRHSIDQYGYDGMRSILADNGLVHLELEILLDWFADGERRVASDKNRKFLLEAAARLGAKQIKVAGDVTGTEWPIEHMMESFSDLCRDAAHANTQIAIEVVPVSNIRDLPGSLAIVDGAGAANGGLVVDILHMHRGGISLEDLAKFPAHYIKHVEIGDAAWEPVGTIMEDALNHRTLPGSGELDIQGFLRCIASTGYDGPYGIEILSRDHRKLPLAEAAAISFEAGQRQFDLLAGSAR
ncbi:MAG: sugar phosphate isomerase/epimerase [Sphingobium sp.]|nr:sugar phosphate isomerase/epimerase [Sphingobium sp.]